MHIITHYLTGWAASLPLDLDTRDRGLIGVASILPDLDGIVVIGDLVQGRSLDCCELYATYHHVLCHNLLFAVVTGVAIGCLAHRKLATGAVSLLAVHLHFLADVIGSGGPDGSIWEIHSLFPFFDGGVISVSWQWALNAWPNIVLTLLLISIALITAWKHGVSPIAPFSKRADGILIAILRGRFGDPT